jgi:acetylornithine deacetylase/succinyl-diaminopimelate desuccinylase-like protein
LILLPTLAMAAPAHAGPPDDNAIAERLGQVSPANLLATVRQLEALRSRRSAGEQTATATLLLNRLAALGLAARLDAYEALGHTFYNVVATLPGRDPGLPPLVLTAHLDSIADRPTDEAPGADDDATGVAALLEIGRLLAGGPALRTIELIFFSNEEVDRLGSTHHARRAREDRRALHAVVNIDQIGWTDASRVLLIESEGAPSLRRKIRRGLSALAAARHPRGRFRVGARPPNRALALKVTEVARRFSQADFSARVGDECGCGDEGSFWREGYDAVYVASAVENPNRHEKGDTSAHLDLGALTEATRGLVAVALSLAAEGAP